MPSNVASGNGIVFVSIGLTLMVLSSIFYLDTQIQTYTKIHEATIYKAKRITKQLCSYEPDGPKGVILVSHGSSETDAIWEVLGQLTGGKTGLDEFPGKTVAELNGFFTQVGSSDGGNWLLNYLCNEQLEHPDAGIVGFKWRPHHESFLSIAAKNGLNAIAQSGKAGIKVVRSRSNLLDALILDSMPESLYENKITKVRLPAKDLIHRLHTMKVNEDAVDRLLVDMNIPHVQVSYDNLFYRRNGIEWMKILTFLRKRKYVVMQDVHQSLSSGAPKRMKHRDVLLNFDEVKQTLKGTEFESLLH